VSGSSIANINIFGKMTTFTLNGGEDENLSRLIYMTAKNIDKLASVLMNREKHRRSTIFTWQLSTPDRPCPWTTARSRCAARRLGRGIFALSPSLASARECLRSAASKRSVNRKCKCKEACIALCHMKLRLVDLAQAWPVLNSVFAQSCLPPTRLIPARAEQHLVIYISNLQQQSPAVY